MKKRTYLPAIMACAALVFFGCSTPATRTDSVDAQTSDAQVFDALAMDAMPLDAGASVDADAADAECEYVRVFTRVVCGGGGDCPPKQLNERSCINVTNEADTCIAEIATGDLYRIGSISPIVGAEGRLRRCTEEERQLALGIKP
jgi:hypothetical protein